MAGGPPTQSAGVYAAHRAMFRDNPLRFIIFVSLALAMSVTGGCAPMQNDRIAVVQDISEPGEALERRQSQSPNTASKRTRLPIARVATGSVKPADTPEAASAAMEERYRRQEEAGRRWSRTICSGC
jgi:hypothetical protein